MGSFTNITLLILLSFLKKSESNKDNISPSIIVNGIETVDSFDVIEHADIKVECSTKLALDSTVQLSLKVDDEKLIISNIESNNATDNTHVFAEKKNVLRNNKKLQCSQMEKSNKSLTTTVRLNVMYPPKCTISIINGKKNDRYLSCNCQANPSVRVYWFAANDKVIYNSTGKRISTDRIYPGATNITCSAQNVIHAEEIPALLIIPSNQKSRRPVQAIVGVVLTVFYSIVLAIIAFRYRNHRKREYAKSTTVNL